MRRSGLLWEDEGAGGVVGGFRGGEELDMEDVELVCERGLSRFSLKIDWAF